MRNRPHRDNDGQSHAPRGPRRPSSASGPSGRDGQQRPHRRGADQPSSSRGYQDRGPQQSDTRRPRPGYAQGPAGGQDDRRRSRPAGPGGHDQRPGYQQDRPHGRQPQRAGGYQPSEARPYRKPYRQDRPGDGPQQQGRYRSRDERPERPQRAYSDRPQQPPAFDRNRREYERHAEEQERDARKRLMAKRTEFVRPPASADEHHKPSRLEHMSEIIDIDPETGEFWLYGVNPVIEALRAGSRVKVVYLSAQRQRITEDIRQEAVSRGVEVHVMHDPTFFDRKFPKGHQGVAALSEGGRVYDIEELMNIPKERGEEPFFVVVDLIEDPRNLGAVLRSAEAAGVHGVVIQERRSASPFSAEAMKTSAGATEHVPVCIVSNIKHAIRRFLDEGILVVGTEAGVEETAWDSDLGGPLAIVVGSEGKGMRRTVSEHCTKLIALPMLGKVNSLNTSVAAGVVFYEVLRQRRARKAV